MHITAVTQGTYGTVSSPDGINVTYTGTGGDSGTDSFTFTVSDLYGGSSTATGNVIITSSSQGFNLISSATLDGNRIVLTYLGVPGQSYAVEHAFSLTYPIAWVPQVTNVAATNGWLIFTNSVNPAIDNFWRTRWVP